MLGERIDTRRKELGMSQKDLAERAELSPGYVNDLIKNRRGTRLSLSVAQRLSKALRVKPLFLSESFADANTKAASANSEPALERV